MADVSLNGLKVKTDSLPNDWYVSIINPKDGEPAEIMTVAKFVEMFTEKQPEATKNSKGLMSANDYSLVRRLKQTLGVGYVKIAPGTAHYHQIQLLLTGGEAPSAATYSINAISVKNNAVPFITRLTAGNNIEAYYRIVEGIAELYIKSSSASGNIVILYNNSDYTIETVDSLPSGTTEVTVSTFSVSTSIENALYAFEPNVLTETIQTSPVLESRQVRSTCLQNHLYQTLLVCLDRKSQMVQLQLKVNQPRCRSSTFGLSTKLEKRYLNYRKKINISNKSSRLTA